MADAGSQRFDGWRVTRAAFVLAMFGWGVGFYGPPIFLKAVQDRTGWPLALVSGAVTLHFLFGAVVVANLPRLHRRFGIPAVTRAGAMLLGTGVLGWSLAAAPWQLMLAALFSGAGWVALGAAAVNAIVSRWFAVGRPAALGLAYNGASLGGVVLSPLWVAVISGLGFPAAAALVGAVLVLVVWMLAGRYFAKGPEDLGQWVDGASPASPLRAPPTPAPAANLWRDRRFLTLAAGMALGLFAQLGLLSHLYSLLTPALGGQGAGLALGLATAASIAGRSLVGRMMPQDADRRLVAGLCYGGQVAGCLILLAAGDGLLALLLGVVLFGAGIGNATSLPPLIVQREFGAAEAGRVVALIVALSQGAYAFAPLAFGLLRAVPDAGDSGGGRLVFIAAATIEAAAIAVILLGRAFRGNPRRRPALWA